MNGSGITRRSFLLTTAAAGVLPGTLALAANGAATLPQPSPSPRPRLYFTAADLPAMRRRFETDESLRPARTEILKQAETTLTRELVKEDYAKAGGGQHGNYYAAAASASAAIETCGFAYLLTGERRFADHARKALRHFAQYNAWTGEEFAKRDPAWHSALETAHFTRAYALGIDWLADVLEPEERQIACDALARLGVEPAVRDWLDPARRVHALDSMGHNWWMVCVAAAGLGAMSLMGEDPRAEQWLNLALDSMPEFFAYPGNLSLNKVASFDPAGGFYESLSYTDYTLRYYAYLMAALRHMYPDGFGGQRFDRLPPQLTGMFEFMQHFLYPLRKADGSRDFLTVGFGDDGHHTAFSGDAVLFLAQASGDGRYRWYFDQYCGGVSGFYQMIFHDPDKLPKAQPPTKMKLSRALEGIGWASMRDSWEDNATFLAIKCGHTWNHAHADAASFVVYAGGEPLLIDPGSCSYGRKEYRSYYTESIAHNTVLVDGQGQPRSDGERGTKFPGQLHAFLDVDGCRYVLADGTGPMAHLCKRFYRHVLWLDETIVVLDDLLAHKASRFGWLFHGQTTPQFENSTLKVQNGTARLEMNVLFPQQIEAEVRKGLVPKNPDRPLDYMALRQREATESTKFLAVLRAGRELPAVNVESRQGTDWIGARLKASAWQWDLYCNLRADGRRQHRNSNHLIDQWETDAFLVGVRSGSHRRLLLIDASYLRRDGQVIFDCFSKCNAVLVGDGENSFAEVYIQAPEHSIVRVASRSLPSHASINGRTIPPNAMSQRGGLVHLR